MVMNVNRFWSATCEKRRVWVRAHEDVVIVVHDGKVVFHERGVAGPRIQYIE
jgi:hypothetical protein